MRSQTEVFRAMTPEQRLAAAARLYWTARELKEAALRAFHPDWTDEQVRRAVREPFLFASDGDREGSSAQLTSGAR